MKSYKFLKVLTFFLLLGFFGCGKDQNVKTALTDLHNPRPAPVVALPKISSLRWYPHEWEEDWSHHLRDVLKAMDLINVPLREDDLSLLGCPNYNDLKAEEKVAFWSVFMASISSQESAFDPTKRYYERSLGEWSEGLFQVSLSDQKPYSGCANIDEKSILDPLENIRCALSIMETQVVGSRYHGRPIGQLFPKRYFYWSVLTRETTLPKVIEFFKRHLDQLPFC